MDTFVFAQEVDALLQDGGLVHLAGVARQHGAQFFDEHIELVSPLLLRLVPGNSAGVGARQTDTHVIRLHHTMIHCENARELQQHKASILTNRLIPSLSC